jgi:hypothetical protein
MVKTERTYSLQGAISNASWIEENTPVGEVFDHLTQLYTLVYEGMSPVHPEFKDFSFEHIEMTIPESCKNNLTEALLETKRMVDSYMIKENFPCFMEFAGGTVPQSV